MYARPTDRVDDHDAALDLLAEAPFVHLVSGGTESFEASSLPMLVDRDGRLVGHLARANSHWRSLDGAEVLVIAVASQAYVSPSWYPSKHDEGGRVVPTWNYEAVQVRGRAEVHHDGEWLAGLVEQLTDVHEARRTDGGEVWRVEDAPSDFIDRQLAAIVGVSVSIDRIDAKQKLSGNRTPQDRRGVVDGLSRTEGAPTRMITTMRSMDDPT